LRILFQRVVSNEYRKKEIVKMMADVTTLEIMKE